MLAAMTSDRDVVYLFIYFGRQVSVKIPNSLSDGNSLAFSHGKL
jgi:hypothetical protein